MLHTPRLPPAGGTAPSAAGKEEWVSPQLAQLVLEIVKLGMTAVVLVVLALILS